jgi:hypothetical protein
MVIYRIKKVVSVFVQIFRAPLQRLAAGCWYVSSATRWRLRQMPFQTASSNANQRGRVNFFFFHWHGLRPLCFGREIITEA